MVNNKNLKKVEEFFTSFNEKSFKKGELIIEPEEEIKHIYFITSGYARSYTISENGNELTINLYKPKSYFPLTFVLTGKVNPYFFEAFTDIKIRIAPSDSVLEFIKNEKDILFDLTKRISIGLEGFITRTQFLIQATATQKVAATLIMQAKRFGVTLADKSIKITLPQTHQDIAHLSGISRETASLEIKRLERRNIIRRDKKLTFVKNINKLKGISQLYIDDKPLPYSF